MSKKSKNKSKSYHNKNQFLWTQILPVIIVTALIPLLVRAIPINYPMDQFFWFSNTTEFFDLYSLVKSNAIILVALYMTIYMVIQIKKRNIVPKLNVLYISSAVYAFFIILSTIMSVDPYISVRGFYERYENIFVLLGYLIIMLFTYHFVTSDYSLKTIIKWFTYSNIALCTIGLLQFIGLEPLFNKFSRVFTFSITLFNVEAQLNLNLPKHVISQTLYHYNYVGFYIAMSLPFFIVLTINTKEKRERLLYAFTSLFIVFNLFGSTARGGLLGSVVGILLVLFLNRKQLFANKKLFALIASSVVILLVIVEVVMNGYFTSRLANMFKPEAETRHFKEIYAEDNHIYFILDDGQIDVEVLSYENGLYDVAYYLNGEQIYGAGMDQEDKLYFKETGLETFKVYVFAFKDEGLLCFDLEGTSWPFSYANNELLLMTPYGKTTALAPIEKYGFEGKERLGSARGYIWSRSIPLLKKAIIKGYGPDTFATIFPQHDFLGKYYSYNTMNIVVDKVHNLYLQIALSTGIPSLIAFLVLIGYYFLNSIKIYFRGKFENISEVVGLAIFVALVGYFVAGFFNDSTVHVSPVFWALLGLGYGVNGRLKEVSNK